MNFDIDLQKEFSSRIHVSDQKVVTANCEPGNLYFEKYNLQNGKVERLKV
jgi:hypothetical protein